MKIRIFDGKKLKNVLESFFAAVILGLFICNGSFAYDPDQLYDDVWKVVNEKHIDADKNYTEWKKWRHKYDEKIETPEDAYVAIDTMLASLGDPYTKFLDPREFADENQSIRGTLFGIGIQIGLRDGNLVVISPIEETPADKAGLKANDEIVEINDELTKGISVKNAADKIRGKKGTTVKLLIKRGDKNLNFIVMRDKIALKSVSTRPPEMVKLKRNIGYIRLSTFMSSKASNEMQKAIDSMSNKDGLIIDLRSNPGGLLSNAISMSDMFLKGGDIVSTVDRDGYKKTQKAQISRLTEKPIIVLINKGSASASEIFSGAMKDNHRALLVGESSFGKGLVQEINRLNGGAGVNVTTQKYLTPNGDYIHKIGIVPDIEVKLTEEDIKENYDRQLDKAQEIIQDLIAQDKAPTNEFMIRFSRN